MFKVGRQPAHDGKVRARLGQGYGVSAYRVLSQSGIGEVGDHGKIRSRNSDVTARMFIHRLWTDSSP